MNPDMTAAQRQVAPRDAEVRRDYLLWGAALLPFLALALWRLRDGPGLSADDYGQYLMHARALAEGRPYTDIGYIFSPFRPGLGPASSPPGLPLTLAAVYFVLGPNIIAMRLLMLCFATVFVLVAGLYFARHGNRELGIGVALLCGLPLGIADNATQLLSDLPCAALIWLAIYLIDKPAPFRWQRLLAIAFLGALAVAFRVPAVALMPALVLFVALRYRENGLRIAAPLFIWLIAGAVLLFFLPLGRLSPVGLDSVTAWSPAVGLRNAREYLTGVFEAHLHPFPWALANDAFHVATGIFMLIGIGAWLRGGETRFATIFALAYSTLLLLLPIRTTRYLWPLFPFFVFGLLNGIRIAGSGVVAYAKRANAIALLFAVLLVPRALIDGLGEPRRGGLIALPEVQGIVRGVRASSAQTPRVVFYKPRSFAWETGIPAMGVISGSARCLVSELARGRITHAIAGNIETGQHAEAQQDLIQLARSRPDIFAPEMQSEHFVLYRVAITENEARAARAACAGG